MLAIDGSSITPFTAELNTSAKEKVRIPQSGRYFPIIKIFHTTALFKKISYKR